jgi:signal peptidase I
MSMSKSDKAGRKKAGRKDRAVEVANTFEWLITAFVLAFLFRAFVMEAFRIPTGSMADTLKGAHFRLRCPQCGYQYDYGFEPQNYGLPQDTVPGGYRKPPRTRCPSCGYYPPAAGALPVSNGDRILVLKCLYQFLEPRRWDVVVFKNPLDPKINYIKRLVALPGETVEIIDGDIYIDGEISRKPPKVQNELWMPVYNNDYLPARPAAGSFNGHIWRQPFKNIGDSKWRVDESNPTGFRLDSTDSGVHSLIYDTSVGNDLRATYAYDDVRGYNQMPYCSDLMVRCYVPSRLEQGIVGIELTKYEARYRAWVDFTGEMFIAKVSEDGETILKRGSIRSGAVNEWTVVKFANVDHQLIFRFGREKLKYDLGQGPADAGPRITDIEPQVKIFGSGQLRLSHVAIFRDTHYMAAKFANSRRTGRAGEGNPFGLGRDEFFMLGDNSPNSEDGRWWNREGVGNNGRFYQAGIVPRDYLVGKALFVYWPGGFRPFAQSRFAFIPNFGRMRFIYGGASKNL